MADKARKADAPNGKTGSAMDEETRRHFEESLKYNHEVLKALAKL